MRRGNRPVVRLPRSEATPALGNTHWGRACAADQMLGRELGKGFFPRDQPVGSRSSLEIKCSHSGI